MTIILSKMETVVNVGSAGAGSSTGQATPDRYVWSMPTDARES